MIKKIGGAVAILTSWSSRSDVIESYTQELKALGMSFTINPAPGNVSHYDMILISSEEGLMYETDYKNWVEPALIAKVPVYANKGKRSDWDRANNKPIKAFTDEQNERMPLNPTLVQKFVRYSGLSEEHSFLCHYTTDSEHTKTVIGALREEEVISNALQSKEADKVYYLGNKVKSETMKKNGKITIVLSNGSDDALYYSVKAEAEILNMNIHTVALARYVNWEKTDMVVIVPTVAGSDSSLANEECQHVAMKAKRLGIPVYCMTDEIAKRPGFSDIDAKKLTVDEVYIPKNCYLMGEVSSIEVKNPAYYKFVTSSRPWQLLGALRQKNIFGPFNPPKYVGLKRSEIEEEDVYQAIPEQRIFDFPQRIYESHPVSKEVDKLLEFAFRYGLLGCLPKDIDPTMNPCKEITLDGAHTCRLALPIFEDELILLLCGK